MTPLCICRSKPFLLPSSFSRRRLFPGHDFKQCFILLMCHLLQPIFYDVVSSLMCHLFLYPLWLDSTGCEVSPCYEDTLKTGFGLSVFYFSSVTLLQMQCYCIRMSRSISLVPQVMCTIYMPHGLFNIDKLN